MDKAFALKRSPIIALVLESHPIYSSYIKDHMNESHPSIARAIKHFSNKVFLNGGVFVVDAVQWRQQNITARAEQLIRENSQQMGRIYDSRVGDQAVFYALLYDRMACLPANYNMRRLPKKTVHLLETQQLGTTNPANVKQYVELFKIMQLLRYFFIACRPHDE